MSIQCTVLGFELKAFRTRVSYRNHSTKRPVLFFLKQLFSSKAPLTTLNKEVLRYQDVQSELSFQKD